MRFHRAILLAAASAAVVVGPVRAAGEAPAASPPATRPAAERTAFLVLDTGYDWGSTDLLTIELSDGSSQTLSANAGFWMAGGVAFLRHPVGNGAIDSVATIGFKYKSIGASNGSFRYLAFPLEVMERISAGPMRAGLGLSLALAPSLEGSGVLSAVDVSLKQSLGVVARVDFIGKRKAAGPGWFVGARFVWQKLEAESGGAPVGANAFGLSAGVEL